MATLKKVPVRRTAVKTTRKPKSVKQVVPREKIKTREVNLTPFAEKMYSTYTKYAIETRVAPDYRDGMQAVHRRVLYSMHRLGLRSTSNKPVKSARIVGDALGLYHPHGDCLRGDTLVPLLNGRLVTIKSLSDKGAGAKWVLALNTETGKLEPSKAYNWKVGHTTRDLFRVVLTNGEVIECTGNHPFYTKAGWVQAAELEPGQSLVGGVIKRDADGGGYHRLYFRGTSSPLHRYIADSVYGGLDAEDIVHKDEHTHNNKPSNLALVSRAEHCALHVALGSIFRKLLRRYEISDLTWRIYLREARRHAGRNEDTVLYCDRKRLSQYFNSDDIQSIITSVVPYCLLSVVRVEHVVLEEAEDFYDFTVDGHHNMIVASPQSKGKDMLTFCVVHNTACYQAMVNLTGTRYTSNVCQKLIEGQGNWGTLSDSSFAAMRYTEAKLSSFSDSVLFDPFYVAATHMVPNFDSSTVEPEVLPALLPVLLLNGKFGIAPGIQVSIPSFTLPSVKALLDAAYSGEAVDAQLCYKHLRFTTTYGGVPENTKENKAAMREFIKTGKGRIVFESELEVDEKTRTILVTKFAVDSIDRPMANVAALTGVQSCLDISTKTDQYATVEVKCTKTMSLANFNALVPKVRKAFSDARSFLLNMSHREFNPKTGDVDIHLLSPTVAEFITKWIEWRRELELRACAHWVAVADKKIDYQNLMLLAVDSREIIIRSLDKDCSMAELEQWLAQQLKITVEQAKQIYDLHLRQLRKLDKVSIAETRDKLIEEKRVLNTRIAKPMVYMRAQLKTLGH